MFRSADFLFRLPEKKTSRTDDNLFSSSTYRIISLYLVIGRRRDEIFFGELAVVEVPEAQFPFFDAGLVVRTFKSGKVPDFGFVSLIKAEVDRGWVDFCWGFTFWRLDDKRLTLKSPLKITIREVHNLFLSA